MQQLIISHPNTKMQDSDHFSLLPDALLLVIIAFLPFRDAVRTSILSQRWRNLWHSTTNIDIDEKFFVNSDGSDEEKAMQRAIFMHFINQWMDNFNQPNIHAFRLCFTNPPQPHVARLRDCAAFAAGRRGIKAFALDFSDQKWDENNLDDAIPQISMRDFHITLDAHRSSLETVALSGCSFSFPQIGLFSALKSVALGWMEIVGSALDEFVGSCPSLESLRLKRCWSVGSLDICGRRLRRLVIDKCWGAEYVSVTAPLLEFYSYSGVAVYLQMDDHQRMEEAVFDFGEEREWGGESDAEMLYNLLTEIWCVRILTICSYMLQVIPMAEEGVRLRSVRHLILKTQLHIQEYYGITYFLKSCPMLEVLTIDLSGSRRILQEYEAPHRVEEHPFMSNLWYPTCVERSLKAVKVVGFKGGENEMVVLKYLVKYGRALEALYIILSKHNGNQMESTYRRNAQTLMHFQFKSPTCRLFISN